MKDFLLYDIWGNIMYNLPALALSIYIGYLVNKSLSKKENTKKYSKIISIIITLIIFGFFVSSFKK